MSPKQSAYAFVPVNDAYPLKENRYRKARHLGLAIKSHQGQGNCPSKNYWDLKTNIELDVEYRKDVAQSHMCIGEKFKQWNIYIF